MAEKNYSLVLASGSPRRREMLASMGYKFKILTADYDESAVCMDDPAEGVRQLALGKARASCAAHPQENAVFLGADTVVALGGRVLGKPHTPDEARAMLRALSGKTHSVFTGVAVVSADESESFVSETKVKFYDITDEEIDAYVRGGSPMDKAGAYGIQDQGGLFVESISGDYNTVVGLPLAMTYKVLKKYGINPQNFNNL